jgi:tetratricopeptide (TPR) repeat protein
MAAVVGREPPEPGLEGVRSPADLVRALDVLRQRAARGSGRGRVSLDRLARASGIPRSTVHSYVSGTRLPPADALDAIIVALGATTAEQRDWAEALERASAPEPAADPGPALPALPSAAEVPRQLPARPVGFVGRERELADLVRAVERALADEDAPAVIAVSGIGGVGKTALVLHWAHRSAHLFPDGQLWVDLRAFSAGPALEAGDALERMLRAVGVGTAELPSDVDARAAIFRSAVAGRRMLLVVDNARDSEHVRSLLPGTPGFVTVVTSRDAMRSLVAREGAHRLQIDRLEMGPALELLTAGRNGASPVGAAAERIAARCDGLPLALRIVRERLAHAGAGEIDRLAGELEGGSSSRLAALELDEPAGGIGVRSVMEWSYRSLPPDAATAFRRIPQCLVPTFDTEVMGVLLDCDRPTARRRLEQLVAANLLDAAGPDLFRVHDLVAAYAAECLAAEEAADTVFETRIRLLEYLVSSVEEVLRACDRSRPIRLARPEPVEPELRSEVSPFSTSSAAQAWTAAHTDMLVAAVLDAADDGPVEYSWVLGERAWRAMWFFGNVGVLEPAVRAMQNAAHRTGVAEAGYLAARLLAIGYAQTARLAEAARGFEAAIALATGAGDDYSARLDLANLAMVRAIAGDLDWAISALSQVIAAAPDGAQDQVPSLTSLIELELQRGDVAAAARLADRTTASPSIKMRRGSFYVDLEALRGAIELESGDIARARRRFTALIAECRAAGNLQILSLALERSAVVLQGLGALEAAETAAREALMVSERIGYRSREIDAQISLGDVLREAGRSVEGLAFAERALAGARESQIRYAECRALVIAARARRDLGDRVGALADARAGLAIAERCGYRLLRADAVRLINEPTMVDAG